MKRFSFLLVLSVLFFQVSCSKQDERKRGVVIYQYGGETEELTLENEFLSLSFQPETAGIILAEKTAGTQWRSSPENASDDPGADYVTSRLMQSQFTIYYSDDSTTGLALTSHEYSVQKLMYEYGLEHGVLEVKYTVGTIDKAYIIPPAIPEWRMNQFAGKMNDSDQRIITTAYRLYDINKLQIGDDRAALLSSYPDLARENIYVLRDTVREFLKIELERMMAGAGYTLEDYEEDISRYSPAAMDTRPVFNITLRYELDGNSLVVSVPFNEIAYREQYPITQVSLLPFMGAGSTEDEGYLFVPDGSGAVINFNNGKSSQVPYNIKVYGWDEAMPRDALVTDDKAPFPVYGIQKNGAALLCIIEEGASYASIRADVSGRNCSYNSVYPAFEMIHGALMDISGQSNKLVYLYEPDLPRDERIALRFIPCAAPGYVGMAKEYRSYLTLNHPQMNKKAEGSVPIAVQIIGAVNRIQHRLGFPLDLPQKLSSFREAAGMVEDFSRSGWENVQVKISGWFNGSLDHSVPSSVKLIGELGSKKDFLYLVSETEKNNFDFYVEGDFVFMRDNSPFDTFSLYSDVSQFINYKRAFINRYSFVWFGAVAGLGKSSFLARPAYTETLTAGFISKTASLGSPGIAFRTMGARLGGDYNKKRRESREAALQRHEKILADTGSNGRKVMLNAGFVYAVPYADFLVNLFLRDQSFGIADYAVPFYPIVLHGILPYSGKAVNLAEDYTWNILDSVETGAGLYFCFMMEETSVLQESEFRQFYANEYRDWFPAARILYEKFAKDFSGLYSQTIEDHQILSPGVTVTVYEDGTRVVVNKSKAPYLYGSVLIPGEDYAVIPKENNND